MTLAQQFPDISMQIREKRKSKLKPDAGIPSPTTSQEQRFYDRQFKRFHFKLASFILALLAALFLVILNGQSLIRWIAS